jgi:hypothetical protein
MYSLHFLQIFLQNLKWNHGFLYFLTSKLAKDYKQGVTKRCQWHLSLLTNCALVYEPKWGDGGGGGVRGLSQTQWVQLCTSHGAQVNFGDLVYTPYLTCDYMLLFLPLQSTYVLVCDWTWGFSSIKNFSWSYHAITIKAVLSNKRRTSLKNCLEVKICIYCIHCYLFEGVWNTQLRWGDGEVLLLQLLPVQLRSIDLYLLHTLLSF